MTYRPVTLATLAVALVLATRLAAAEPATPALLGPTPGMRVADSFRLSADRPAGAGLANSRFETGEETWSANAAMVFLPGGGITVSQAGGGAASHAISPAGGRVRVHAEIQPAGSGFTGLALGRNNLANDFWKAYDVLAYLLPGGGYEVLVRGQTMAKGDKAAYGGLNAAGNARMVLELDTPARTLSVTINDHKVLDGCRLATRLSPVSAGFRINDKATPGQPVVRNYAAQVEVMTTAGFVPTSLEDFFVTPGKDASLSFKPTLIGSVRAVPYEIRDYNGRAVSQATASLDSAGSLRVPLGQLQRGYYEIAFPASQETFGVVAIEPYQGVADPFFCLDSAISWLETRPELRPALVKILSRSGIAMSRERLSWGGVNPQADKWNWEGGARQYDKMRQLYAAESLPILEILHGNSGYLGVLKGSPFPQNLPLAVTSWHGVEAKFGSGWGGVEIWNEPDLTQLPGDQYTALTKMVAYAISANAKRPVVGGAYSGLPPGSYFDSCAANGMLEQVDAVSFHGYDRASDVEGMVQRYRQWLRGSGKETMPLWCSECGFPWNLGPDRPPHIEDALSALEIIMKAVESRACGVARYFPFVYTYYEEGPRNFGMMGREVTPLRSMAAYAYCASALGGLTYLGDLETAGTPLKRARVFGKDSGPAVVILYTGKVADGAVVRMPLPVQRVTAADGRELLVAGDDIAIPDGIAYAWLKDGAALPGLKTNTTAAQLLAISRQAPPVRPAASPIVLTYQFDKTPSRASASRYLLDEQAAKSLPISVRVHNLGEQARSLELQLHLPGEDPGVPLRVQKLDVPAHGSADTAWTVNAHPALDVSEVRFVRITATGASAAPLAIPFLMEGSLEQHLSRHAVARRLPIGELSRWTPNIAAHGTMTMGVGEGTWKLTVKYSTATNAWVYPRFELPEQLDPSWASGMVLRARIKNRAANVGVMAYGEGRENYRLLDLFPADGQWHAVYVPFSELKPGPGHPDMQNARLDVSRLRRLELGFGTHVADNEMEVSDLIIVGSGRPAK